MRKVLVIKRFYLLSFRKKPLALNITNPNITNPGYFTLTKDILLETITNSVLIFDFRYNPLILQTNES